MLAGTTDRIAGYARLHGLEAKYTQIAMEENPEIVGVWYDYLTLLVRAVEQEHDHGEEGPSDSWYSWELRLRLLGVATATAKSCLDTALAGYYSQAYASIRHLFETWRMMAYVRLVPTAAVRWYTNTDDRAPYSPKDTKQASGIRDSMDKGAHAPYPPKDTKQASGIRDSTDKEARNNIALVNELIKRCDKGAHPSRLVISQVDSGRAGFLQMSANYISQLFVDIASLGTCALALVTDEASKIVAIDAEWRSHWGETAKTRKRWHDALPEQTPIALGGNDGRD